MGRIGFVAMCYIAAIAGIIGSSARIWEIIAFEHDTVEAAMVSTDPALERGLRFDPIGPIQAHVSYVGDVGRVEVPGKWLSLPIARRLADGEAVPVRYKRSDPLSARYDGQRDTMPWVFLIVGVLALGLALYATRLLKREGVRGSSLRGQSWDIDGG